MDLVEQKKKIRGEMKEKLRAADQAELATASQKLCQKISELPEFQQAQNLAFYMPLKTEANILPLLETSLKQKKNCFVPKVRPDGSCLMDFYLLANDKPLQEQLEPGAFGIMEPKSSLPKLTEQIPPCELCMLVPAVSFDKSKNRLGKGKGFYDRFLQNYPKPVKKIGVCFDFQLIGALPTESTDFPMDVVITEKKIIGCEVPRK